MASTTRITGMYSGLDTEKLVEEMLAANKTPMNNYQRELTEVEWQRETLLDLNKELLELQNLSKDMQEEASFKVYTAESTNSRAVTASATTEAKEGTYRIITEQLATTTTYTSESVSKNLANIQSEKIRKNTSFENTAFNITLNGVTKTITFGAGEGQFTSSSSSKEIADAFQQKIDDAFGANQIAVEVTAGSRYNLIFECAPNAMDVPIVISSADDAKLTELGMEDALAKMGIESGATNVFDTSKTIAELTGTEDSGITHITFSVNGHEETISTQTTLADLFKKINNMDAGVTVKYDALSDAIIMKRTESGAGREIEITDDLDLFKTLGFNNNATYSAGQNAKVSIIDPEGRERVWKEIQVQKQDADGSPVFDADGNPVMVTERVGGLEIASNSFTYEGVNFNLTKANPNEEVSVTIAKDVDKVFDNVVKFVDKYNDVLGKLNTLYNEKPNKDYDPLLEEERDELSDSQQEKWDKLAKQGILYRDSTLSTAISSMRSAVTSLFSTNGDIKSLFQIGITTTEYSSVGNNNGKLIIDEEKLREAISNNMDEISDLFTSKPDYISGTVIPDGTTISQGSSFKITVNGREETITFDKDYDLSDSDQRSEMISNINSIFTSKFGSKNIVMTISSGRVVITSQRGNSITLNSGDSNDALAKLGLEDGATYDANALGFANKINNIMQTVQEAVTSKAGTSSNAEDESTLGTRMSELNKYISKQKDRLATLEDRYYAQFAAMENALAQMESQSSYLTNMLSGSGM